MMWGNSREDRGLKSKKKFWKSHKKVKSESCTEDKMQRHLERCPTFNSLGTIVLMSINRHQLLI